MNNNSNDHYLHISMTLIYMILIEVLSSEIRLSEKNKQHVVISILITYLKSVNLFIKPSHVK